MSAVYITHAASELPGAPVPNDQIERYLGVLHPDRRRLRDKVLANNGIRTRHYAIDPETGAPTHTLAQLQANAIRRLLDKAGLDVADVDLLSCSTAVPEVITPGIASTVHGELGGPPMEICSAAGVCASSMTALKYAWMAVGMGGSRRAVVSGGERTSALMRASHFQAELQARRVDEEDPLVALQAEFLRWMLSDGAGSVLIEREPTGQTNFEIEWVQSVSYANELPTCMYLGGARLDDGSVRSYRDEGGLMDAVRAGQFNLRQDTRLLRDHIIPTCTTRTLEILERDRGLTPDQVDWVLPHWSSALFAGPGTEAFQARGYQIADDHVSSNLQTRGNIGSAAPFTMLDDLVQSGRVQSGEGVLLLVPESGRFHVGYALLRAV